MNVSNCFPSAMVIASRCVCCASSLIAVPYTCISDFLDFVKDPISSGDYKREEDPLLFQSEKTQRGPLQENWREEYSKACKDPTNRDKSIMCAYKLCKVEFRYWGMQSKIERFIHDIGEDCVTNVRVMILRASKCKLCGTAALLS